MNDTPTPRTDAESFRSCIGDWGYGEFVPASFARDLERQLEEATAWRPIEETPPEGVNIVLWSAYECEVGQRWGDDYSREDMKCLGPTHWQPLPNPPTL